MKKLVESEPVAYMYQHEDTGEIGFVEQQQLEWGFEKINPRLQVIGPLYAVPQQAKAELNFDIDTFALNLMQDVWSIGNMYKPDEQRKEMIKDAITNAIESLIQPPEKPE